MKKRKKMKNKFLVVKKIIGNFLEPSRYKMHETKQTNNTRKSNETDTQRFVRRRKEQLRAV